MKRREAYLTDSKMKIVTFLILCILIVSCGISGNRDSDTQLLESANNPKDDALTANADSPDFTRIESYLVNIEPDSKMLSTYTNNCAILIYPTIDQINEMKKTYGEDDFYILADDNNWYQGTSIELLDSLKIQIITETKPYLRFLGRQGTWTVSARQSGMPPWNLIFFNCEKTPEIISPIDLTISQIVEYFGTDTIKAAYQ